MKFREKLAGAAWLLLCDGRVTYQRLAVEFKLDAEALDTVRQELVQVRGVAADENGECLVWTGPNGPMRKNNSSPSMAKSTVLPLIQTIASSSTLETLSAPEQPSTKVAASTNDAERRPLTVMFCDLADSTALSTTLDPEDLQDVIRAYQETCAAHIREYEGFIAKYMGDGILVYFGYPKSLERNAERAIRSALEIVGAMAKLNQTLGREKGIEIAVRIGIATGTVMVGEVLGEGMAQERTVIGEAPNMAARLQGLADRNGIVVGDLTRDLCGDVFVYEDLGSNVLKGIEGKVQTWRVAGVHDHDVRDNRVRDNGITAPVLIGRDEEIGLLRRAWQSTKEESRGQVVTLSGEAGIGKSVLIDGCKSEVFAEGLPQLTMRCSPYHTNSALYPVIEHFKRLARWLPGDEGAVRLEKLEEMLGRYSQPLAEAVPLMASLLSLPLPGDSYAPLDLAPQMQRQQIQDMIVGITMEVAERRPFLQIWEDVHWADPSTLELIGVLVEQAPTASLLILMTARPEFVPPWNARSHVTPISLNRLERPHAEALVARIASAKPLPKEVVDHIVTKTDGVPLYVEELTKTILTSDILRDAGFRFELTGPLASLAIPETLQDSLMARLDRLPQVRELAQLGSVLGREFAYEMISGLATAEDGDLQAGLGQLVDAELLYQRGRPPRAKYIFKHALVQDAAYASLLRRTREQYHRRAAELLEARFPEIIETSPEIIAQHYGEGGEIERSVEYYRKAGERAARNSANAEAIAHLAKGLDLLRTLPETVERAQGELDLLTTLGPALIASKGYAALELDAPSQRALELSKEVGNATQQFSALHRYWFLQFCRSNHDKSRELAEELVEMAKGQTASGLELAANRALGYSLQYLGDLTGARFHMELVADAYDPSVHGGFAFVHGGADPGAGSICQIALTLFALGYPDQAARRIDEAIDLSQRLEHPFTEAWVRTVAAMVSQFRCDPKQALHHAEIALEIARERGLSTYLGWASVLINWASFELEGSSDSVAKIRTAISISREAGGNILVPNWLALQSDVCRQTGQMQDALETINKAIENVSLTGEFYWEAELYRRKGELLLAGNQPQQSAAEASFKHAIEVSKSQDAKSWELRSVISLARLWKEQGRQDEARSLVAPVYSWFTEGFEGDDAKMAKRLLAELN